MRASPGREPHCARACTWPSSSPCDQRVRRCPFGRRPRQRERVVSAGSVRHDIADRGDIADLLDDFYRRVFTDEVLSPIFVEVARVDLSTHLPMMCDFWSTVLLRDGTYHRNALRPHLDLDARCELTETHFARWRSLWTATVDQRHAGKRAELAKSQATRIAGAIRRRLPGEQAREFATISPRHPEQGTP